ncbi:S1 family peptidase [Streptomyces sp. C36]|uniref:S1 family peptidase n=1 Tax=Streptomyces sp. C36 TaxID=3237122 RepID=UPI0034C6DB06
MKLRRMPVRAVLAGAAIAALAIVTPTPQQAQAAPGDGGGGGLVAGVVDTLDRVTGAHPGRARIARARLESARATLDERVAIPGTAWVTDPRAGRVVVTADPTVTGAKLAKLNEAVAGLGEAVTIRRTSTRLTRFIAGGDAVWGPNARCSLGFPVKRAGKPDGFLTAGHCGNAVTTWSATRGGPPIARTEASTFPGADHAVAAYTAAVDHPSAVSLYDGTSQPITGAGPAALDEAVRRSGSTTGVHAGKVTGLNATVNYPEGQVRGLIKTNVCAQPGDSGGPLFDGPKALGLLSGGSGDCVLGGETYYQPVQAALAAYGATLG